MINRYTQVFMSRAVEVPQNILDSAMRIEKTFTTAEASLSPKKTTTGTMKGIVTHLSQFIILFKAVVYILGFSSFIYITRCV